MEIYDAEDYEIIAKLLYVCSQKKLMENYNTEVTDYRSTTFS